MPEGFIYKKGKYHRFSANCYRPVGGSTLSVMNIGIAFQVVPQGISMVQDYKTKVLLFIVQIVKSWWLSDNWLLYQARAETSIAVFIYRCLGYGSIVTCGLALGLGIFNSTHIEV